MKALATVAESVEKIRDDEMGPERERATRKRRATTRAGGIEFSTRAVSIGVSITTFFLTAILDHNVPAPLFQSQAQNCPEFMLSPFRTCKSSSPC
jgi:hypothetical protein